MSELSNLLKSKLPAVDENEILEEVVVESWIYPKDLCQKMGYTKYKITRHPDREFKHSGHDKFNFMFYKGEQYVCSHVGISNMSKAGKQFYSVLA